MDSFTALRETHVYHNRTTEFPSCHNERKCPMQVTALKVDKTMIYHIIISTFNELCVRYNGSFHGSTLDVVNDPNTHEFEL